MNQDDAGMLDRLRDSGIRIDREGQLWHEGEVIRHEGLRRAIFRWLDRSADRPGRYVLRLDETRFADIDVDDTPIVAGSLRWDGPCALLGLSDGTEEPLDVGSLTVDRDGILRCQVRAGRLEARLSNSAATALAERLDAFPRPRPRG